MKTSMRLLSLAAILGVVPACASAPASDEPELAIDLSRSALAEGKMSASINVDGETILVDASPESRTVTETGDSGDPVSVMHRFRVIELRSANGTAYARYETDITEGDASGSIGGRTFGGAELADRDARDTSAWTTIVHSRPGHVLETVAAAARAKQNAPELAGVKGSLSTLAGSYALLTDLANLPPDTPSDPAAAGAAHGPENTGTTGEAISQGLHGQVRVVTPFFGSDGYHADAYGPGTVCLRLYEGHAGSPYIPMQTHCGSGHAHDQTKIHGLDKSGNHSCAFAAIWSEGRPGTRYTNKVCINYSDSGPPTLPQD
jgi:hypothetical protein